MLRRAPGWHTTCPDPAFEPAPNTLMHEMLAAATAIEQRPPFFPSPLPGGCLLSDVSRPLVCGASPLHCPLARSITAVAPLLPPVRL